MKLKQDSIGIGQNLQHLRKLAGYSQSQFARELQLLGLNVTCDIYKKMEQNRYNIRVYELLAMKEILKVNFDDFFKNLNFKDLKSNME